jgi:putative nucleotidyltransferase with HDIG domain
MISLPGLSASLVTVDELVLRAQHAEKEGRWDVAREVYEKAVYRLSKPEEARLASDLLRWIGRTYLQEGRLKGAEDCFEAALAVAELSGDAGIQAHAVNYIAITCQQRGRLDEAEDLYHSARVWARQAKDQRLLAMIEQNLGAMANIRGDLSLALRRYRTSLEGYRELDLREHIAPVLNNLAMLLTQMGAHQEAESLYREGFEIALREEDVGTQVAIQVNRVSLWIAKEDYSRAREACDAAYGLARRRGATRWLGEIHKHFGVIARNTADLDGAEEELRKAEELAREAEDGLLVAETLRELAEVYWQAGRHSDTLGCLNRAYRLFSDIRARRDLEEVDRSLQRLKELFQDIAFRLGERIESKDRYTHGHCNRVAEYGCALAQAAGMEEAELDWFRMGAFLHDVGKMVVPSEILNKAGPLSPEERREIERHSVEGERLLAELEFPWDIRPMVRHHHEHWAGSGYPDGLRGEEIPFSARVLCVADVYDALTTVRSYRLAFSQARALEIMAEDSGRLFERLVAC